MVAAAAGTTTRVRAMPVWLARIATAALCAVHPRIGQFARFATLLAQHDMIAPALGTMTLERYFEPPRTELATLPA
jgi:hypothetical protein